MKIISRYEINSTTKPGWCHTVENLGGDFKTFYIINFYAVFGSVPLNWVHMKVDHSLIPTGFGLVWPKTRKVKKRPQMISNMGSIPLLPLFSDTLVWEGYLDSWDHSWWSLLKKIQTQPDQT